MINTTHKTICSVSELFRLRTTEQHSGRKYLAEITKKQRINTTMIFDPKNRQNNEEVKPQRFWLLRPKLLENPIAINNPKKQER
jgi:hypothetical protein